MTSDFFVKAIQNLADFYGNTIVTKDKDQLNAWWNFLSFYSDEQVAAAFMHMMDTVPAFPSIQMVTSYIRNLSEITWEQAFAEACANAPYVKNPLYVGGIKQDIVWSDPLVGKCLELIGASELCAANESQRAFLRSQFKASYEAMRSRRHAEKLMNYATNGAANPVMMLVTGDTKGLNRVRFEIEQAKLNQKELNQGALNG